MADVSKVMVERINMKLTELKMNQSQLAEASGVTRAAISRIMKGGRMPTVPVLRKIAQTLSVSIDYLTGASDESEVASVLKEDHAQLEFFRNLQDLSPDERKRFMRMIDAYKGKEES